MSTHPSQRDDGRGHWPAGKRRNPAPDGVDLDRLMADVRRVIDSRRQAGASIKSLAVSLGVDVRTLRKWLSRDDNPPASQVAHLAGMVLARGPDGLQEANDWADGLAAQGGQARVYHSQGGATQAVNRVTARGAVHVRRETFGAYHAVAWCHPGHTGRCRHGYS